MNLVPSHKITSFCCSDGNQTLHGWPFPSPISLINYVSLLFILNGFCAWSPLLLGSSCLPTLFPGCGIAGESDLPGNGLGWASLCFLFHLRGLWNWMGAKTEEGRGRNRDYRGRRWAAWSSVLCVCRGLALQRSSYLWASFKVCLHVFITILGWDDVGPWLPRFTIGKLMPTNLNSRPPWCSWLFSVCTFCFCFFPLFYLTDLAQGWGCTPGYLKEGYFGTGPATGPWDHHLLLFTFLFESLPFSPPF